MANWIARRRLIRVITTACHVGTHDVIVRNGTPLAGDVIDFGLWAIAGETERIEANLSASGSDHCPVVAALRPNG